MLIIDLKNEEHVVNDCFVQVIILISFSVLMDNHSESFKLRG